MREFCAARSFEHLTAGLNPFHSRSHSSSCYKAAHVTKVVVVVGSKADCLTRDLGLKGGVPSVGVFLRDPSPYL